MRITLDSGLQELNQLIELIAENNELQQIKQQLERARDAESGKTNDLLPKQGDEPYIDRIE